MAVQDIIPTLDLSDFTDKNSEDRLKFVNDLGNAYSSIGFVAIKNHGLSEVTIKKLYEKVIAFFDLPDDVKEKYHMADLHGQRGYTGKGKEHAKDSAVGDLKEFYHIGQPAHLHEYPENIFPEEVDGFQDITTDVFLKLEQCGLEILRAIALYLELPEEYFDDKVSGGNSILRPLHYYPIEDEETLKKGAVRASAHGDINLITLLIGASAEGLEVQKRDGEWVGVTALPDSIIVNVGDMLERLTNNKLRSTIHRVVNPPDERLGTSRYSVPFFMHPKASMDLSCLDHCISSSNPKQYEDITAGDFLDQRLREIGLK